MGWSWLFLAIVLGWRTFWEALADWRGDDTGRVLLVYSALYVAAWLSMRL